MGAWRVESRMWAGVVAGAVIALPLAGAAAAGRELRWVFQFPPPLRIPLDYTRFSWAAATAVLLAVGGLGAAWFWGRNRVSEEWRRRETAGSKMAKWGWAAAGWTALWWLLAWTRFEWFAPLQRFTFFPLWLGFIVFLNAVAEARTGTCLMRRAPRTWAMLFATSAVFWWGFEWLNRFVRNWHYLGVQDFGAAAYAIHATLCFSTVLPAVAAMAEVLRSFSGWTGQTATGPRWVWMERRTTAVALGVFGLLALVFTGAKPMWFYPALWVAPLALWWAGEIWRGDAGVPQEVARGDWSRAATWMMAALLCGFFWELWNVHSAAKWIYTVPGVERWRVFEMPLLGYAGYLPFGLECLIVAEGVMRRWGR